MTFAQPSPCNTLLYLLGQSVTPVMPLRCINAAYCCVVQQHFSWYSWHQVNLVTAEHKHHGTCLQTPLYMLANLSPMGSYQHLTCNVNPPCLQTWESKAKHASNDKETALKQVSELQERLDAHGSSAQQSSQAIRAVEQRTAALQRQMRVKVHTCHVGAFFTLQCKARHTDSLDTA